MAEYPTLIKTLIALDATLVALMTGGIYEFTALPPNGIKPSTLAAAYTNGKTLKPLCVVRGRNPVPFSRIKDARTQFRPVRQAVEFYLYADRDAGYTLLKAARDRIYTLLDQKRVAGSWKLLYADALEYPDPDLNNACTIKLEYTVIGHLGG